MTLLEATTMSDKAETIAMVFVLTPLGTVGLVLTAFFAFRRGWSEKFLAWASGTATMTIMAFGFLAPRDTTFLSRLAGSLAWGVGLATIFAIAIWWHWLRYHHWPDQRSEQVKADRNEDLRRIRRPLDFP